MSRSLKIFRPVYRVDECLAEMRTCLELGWTGMGYKTLEFEAAWRRYTGLPQAHFVNSATAGLHLAMRLLKEADDWQAGDEVVTTPLTFVSTNHAILYEGLRPVFADVDDHLNLCVQSVARVCTPRTRAVMFVGVGGNPAGLAAITEFCAQRGLRLILDAAHMAGAKLDGRHVGVGADVTVFSYHAVKNLPTADSGMLCCSTAAMDERARELSWMGIDKTTFDRSHGKTYDWQYDVKGVGFKYHGNSIMAALGLVGLRYLDADNAARTALAQAYAEGLRGAEPNVRFVWHAPGSSRHLCQVLVARRAQVIAALRARDIHPGVHYDDNTLYAPYRESAGTCPRARAYAQQVLSLPLHLEMTHDDVAQVCEALREVVEALSPRPDMPTQAAAALS